MNVVGPVPLVLDLRIDHDRFGSSPDPTLNGRLHYPNNIDKSLNETANDKIRKYGGDYNNNPPNTVAFIPVIVGTTGRFHSEFIRLLFLQAHRETDRFLAASGVQSVHHDRSFFHFLCAVFSSMLKSKCGNILVKVSVLRVNLNLDGTPIASNSHTHPSYSQTSRLLTFFRCSSSKTNPVYGRRVNSFVLVCSLSSHRHSYIPLIFGSRFIDS